VRFSLYFVRAINGNPDPYSHSYS